MGTLVKAMEEIIQHYFQQMKAGVWRRKQLNELYKENLRSY